MFGLRFFRAFASFVPNRSGAIITSLNSRSMVPANPASPRLAYFGLLARSTLNCAASSIFLMSLRKTGWCSTSKIVAVFFW
jgi:hypothetical protein